MSILWLDSYHRDSGVVKQEICLVINKQEICLVINKQEICLMTMQLVRQLNCKITPTAKNVQYVC
jgi:hypothetical protein